MDPGPLVLAFASTQAQAPSPEPSGRVEMSAQNDKQQQPAAGFIYLWAMRQNWRRNHTSLELAVLWDSNFESRSRGFLWNFSNTNIFFEIGGGHKPLLIRFLYHYV